MKALRFFLFLRTRSRSVFRLNLMIIGQGWSFGEFLGLGRRWLLLMSCSVKGGWTFKISLANLTTAAVVSSSVSLTPATRKQLRRPYCSRASCLSCSSATSSLSWAMVASRSATCCLRERTSCRRAPMVSSRSWLADLITRTRWAETSNIKDKMVRYHVIFTMGIILLVRHLYIEMAPGVCSNVSRIGITINSLRLSDPYMRQ